LNNRDDSNSGNFLKRVGFSLIFVFLPLITGQGFSLTFSAPEMTEEERKDLNAFRGELDFKWEVKFLLTPYSEKKVALCLNTLNSEYYYTRKEAIKCLSDILQQWDIPEKVLIGEITPSLKTLANEGKISNDSEALWILDFKLISNQNDQVEFLKNSLKDKSKLSKSIKFLVEIGDQEAKKVLVEKLNDLEKSKGKGEKISENSLIETEVAVDQINLKIELKKAKSGNERVNLIKNFVKEQNKIIQNLQKSRRKKRTGNFRVPYYAIVIWPIHYLGEIQDPSAIEALKEIWKDEEIHLVQRRFAQKILFRLRKITLEDLIIKDPFLKNL